MGFSQGYRRRRRQGALGRAVPPASRRQLGDQLVRFAVDRHQGGRTLGRDGAVELRGLVRMISRPPDAQLHSGRTSLGGWRTTVRRP